MKKLGYIPFLLVMLWICCYPQSLFGQAKFRSIAMAVKQDGKLGERIPDNSMIFIEEETLKIIDADPVYTQLYHILKFNPPQKNEYGDVFWRIDCVTESGSRCTIVLGKYQGGQTSIVLKFQDAEIVYELKDVE